MALSAARIARIGGLAFCVAFGGAVASRAEQPSAKPAADDPSALNAEFWGDDNKTKSSDSFTALKAAVGRAEKNATALAAPKTDNNQRVINIAIETPEDAARVLSDATAASNDAVSANALATVVNMVTSPQTREAATALVAPQAQQRVEAWKANLSTGIQGLPGIYLGDNASGNGGARLATPAGYTPVAGGSMGCPSR